MAALLYRKGELVWFNGRPYRIDTPGFDEAVIRDENSGILRTVAPSDLSASPPLVPVLQFDLATIKPAAISKAERVRNAVARIQDLGRLEREVLQELADELGYTPRHIRNLVQRFRASGGQLTAFLRQEKPTRRARLTAEVEKVIEERIRVFFLTKERPTIQSLQRDIAGHCRPLGLPIPSYVTVQRRVAQIDNRTKALKRYGPAQARKVMPLKENAWPIAPWDHVQIDQTPCDLLIVDEFWRRVIGRLTLSVVIDLYSRCILGFAATLEHESTITSALAFTHAVLPKEEWLAQRKLDLQWPVWGKPKILGFDQGPGANNDTFELGLRQYDIQPKIRRKGAPHLHGCVERVIGTLMKKVHELPGTTFSNTLERGEYDAEKYACLTLSEAESLLATIICDIYNREVHESTGERPIKRYRAYYESRLSSPDATLPTRELDGQRFLIDFLPFKARYITRGGFELFNCHYSDSSLFSLMQGELGRKGRRHIVRYDPRDLSRVYVLNGDGTEYLEVQYRNKNRPPITLQEWRTARDKVKAEKRDHITEQSIFEAVQKLREDVRVASEKTKSARRHQERRKEALKGAAGSRALRDGEPSTKPPSEDEGTFRGAYQRLNDAEILEDIEES